ncbi:hypothetical protein AB0F25_30710, partial [Streptomyces wedmorensis]|uniref:cobaltochelatase CobT-related protein n=1 Tax=Streptomyces wedmorensis TaxID=43759 RepID=UPI0034922C85
QDDDEADQDVDSDDDEDLEDEGEGGEDWGEGDDGWSPPQPASSTDSDDEELEGSSTDVDSPVGSGPSDSFDVPPSDSSEAELDDDADESGAGEWEQSADEDESNSGDSSDVEDVREGGSEGESGDVSSDDEEIAEGDDDSRQGDADDGTSNEDDGDSEMDGEEGTSSGSSGSDEGGDEGEGVADGDELLSGTESLSESGDDDVTMSSEGDADAVTEAQDGADQPDPDAEEEAGQPAPEWGEEKGAAEILDHMLGHDHHDEDNEDFDERQKRQEEDEAMEVAIMSAKYFDTTPKNILGFRLHREGAHESVANVDMALAWTHAYGIHGGYNASRSRVEMGIDCPLGEQFSPPESVIGSTLLGARLAFTANRRSRAERGLKSGKVDRRSLGRRAPFDDPRVFHKIRRPGKRDYFVLIGMDVSGSTKGEALKLEKKAVMAEAEVLSRLGINFAIYAHSAKAHEITHTQMSMDLYEIKAPDEPWNSGTRHRLTELGPDGGNVDGHTLEFYRRILDGRKETDKVLQYYTDGAMPASNFHEELAVMKENIKICNDRGYTLMAVGVGTDSPAAHGFDTVQVDEVADVARVVQHLGRRLQA